MCDVAEYQHNFILTFYEQTLMLLCMQRRKSNVPACTTRGGNARVSFYPSVSFAFRPGKMGMVTLHLVIGVGIFILPLFLLLFSLVGE